MLLLLSIVAPFAAVADSFTIKPVELELGKSAILQFNLQNDQEFFGFQADVTLPDGITAGTVTLSDRAKDGDYKVNSKKLQSGVFRITAFSGNHNAFTENDGVLVNLEVSVAADYKGDAISVADIIFTDKDNHDVTLTGSTITPTIGVSEVTLSPTSLAIKVEQSEKLTAKVTPALASDQKITWSSSDESIATVDGEGNVTGIAVGKAIITATSANGKTATCEVSVATNVISVESVEISEATLALKEGDSATLTATVSPDDATNKNITWTSSDNAIATVDATGKVTAVKAGKATITATTSNPNVTATCEVTVSPILAESVTLDATTAELKVGETTILTATVLPENTSDKTVTWSSSDEAVATVDATGKVTAVKAGTAVITAKAGDVSATCTVTVKSNVEMPTNGNIIDQTFKEDTQLADHAYYTWGADIQSMITATGIYMTNKSDKANNYENRDFLTFANPIGSPTSEINISYEVYSPKDKGQDNTYYAINYFNAEGEFVFGIQEYSGGWAYGANIVTVNEDGTTSTVKLPAGHMKKAGGSIVNLTVKFGDGKAIINIDGGNYLSYTNGEGIQSVKLSVTGENGYDRDMYLKNYVVKTKEVEPVAYGKYTIKFVANDEVIKEESKIGIVGETITLLSTETADFFNEDKTVKYIYESNDAEGKTITADDKAVVTIKFHVAATYNYTVKNNVNENVVKGSCLETESVTVPYNRYILAEDGNVWMKEATNKEYRYTFTPDADNFEVNLEYKATEITDVIYFAEAENIEGMTATSANNADIRCSNAEGAYAEAAVEVCTLQPGTYTVRVAGMGGKLDDESKNVDFIVKDGEGNSLYSARTNGSWTEHVSTPITVKAETTITIEGANASHQLDYILITGKAGIAVEDFTLDQTEATMTMGETLTLKAIVTPEYATDVKVTWSSDNTEVATVDNGTVKAVGVGTATITATCAGITAKCAIKSYPKAGDIDHDGIVTIDEAVDITNYVVGKKVIADEEKEYYLKAANVNGDAEGRITFADASAAAELVLNEKNAAQTQSRISAAFDSTMDALVIGRANGTTVPVTLDNSMEYVALQADIILPEGVNFEVKAGSRIAGSHSLMTKKHADNHIRVVLFTLDSKSFADNDAPIFEIVTDSNISASDITISTIIASDSDANGYVLAAKTADTTGVEALGLDSNAPVKVYDLNGRYVSDTVEGLEQGLYIILQGENAKKVYIR